VEHAADANFEAALEQVRTTPKSGAPEIHTLFDEATNTATHVVWDRETRRAAVIDSVLDFDPAAGRISTASAERVVDLVRTEDLTVDWLLETHVHADHLTGANHLRRILGGAICVSRSVICVQSVFGDLFNAGVEFPRDGSAFDRLFDDGDRFSIGALNATVLHVPGHTPADIAYVIGDVVFVGDTIFMPDWGTARTDFPGGDARTLYRSIRRLLAFPEETVLYLCHDYKPSGRDDYRWRTAVGEERRANIHVHDGVDEDSFVALRSARDAKLPVPRLIFPSLQVNMRAGRLPEPEDNGRRYLKIPIAPREGQRRREQD
jgi:glyoxylase-like metal-dependent hydrolase (beta-lactamase superfamily II)